jgi:hypothetical protein
MAQERRWKSSEFGQLSQYNSIPDAMAELQCALEAEQTGVWKGLSIEIVEEGGYGGTNHYIAIRGQRLETDDEMEKRIQEENRMQQYEREQYLRLKKKFEGAP